MERPPAPPNGAKRPASTPAKPKSDGIAAAAELLPALDDYLADLGADHVAAPSAAALDSRAMHFDVNKLAPVGYCTVNASGLVLDCNPATLTLLGLPRRLFIKQRFSRFVQDDDVEGFNLMRKRCAKPEVPQSAELRMLRTDGTLIWVHLTAIARSDEVAPELCLVLSDITERKHSEEAIRESEFRWKFATEGAGDGVWDWNIETGEAQYSPIWKEMLGYSGREIRSVNEERTRRIHPEDQAFVATAMQACLDGTTEHFVVQCRMRCKGGDYKWVLSRGMVVLRSKTGRALRMIGTHTDITERRELEEKAHKLAFFDALTQLPNRRLLNDRMVQAMAASKRSGRFSALLLFDLDEFKPLNDAQGHAVGDLVLVEMARRLRASVREMDTVARYGGDEFVVVLSELEAQAAPAKARSCAIAEKVRQAFAVPMTLAATEDRAALRVQCTVSVGVAIFNGQELSQEEIERWADLARHQAKKDGRNCVRFYEAPAVAS